MREIKEKEKRRKKRSRRKNIFVIIFLFAFSLSAFAHDGKPHNFEDLWRSWAVDPLIIASLALSGWVYAQGVFNLWREVGRGKGIKISEAAAFAGGWFSMLIALVSPLHPWGEVLFSAHMMQHEILMLISAPLFVLSRPLIAALWAMPRDWRRKTKSFFKSVPVEKSWNFLTNAFIAWLIHAIALWVWHIPSLFQATLKSDFVHTLQHVSFFLSALLFWWAIIASPRGLLSYGAGVLYLFTTMIHSGLLGAFLTFTTNVWYPAYEKTTASWGLTPQEDQQLGGLIMWAPAGIVYLIAGLLMFAGWLRESEKRVLRREKQIYGFEQPKTEEV